MEKELVELKKKIAEERKKMEEEMAKRTEEIWAEVIEKTKKKQRIGNALKSWMIPFGDISKGKRIGQGAFFNAYEGIWKGEGGDHPVAIKELLLSKPLTPFEHETLEVMLDLNHPGILPVYGFCYSEEKKVLLIIVKLMHTSLFKSLNIKKEIKTWEEKVVLMKKITSPVHYLNQKKRILHRNIKSLKYLLSKSMDEVCLMFDMCMSIKTPSLEAEDRHSKGTMFWMAPECHDVPAKYSVASDVYALGMVFYEIICEKPPFSDEMKDGSVTQFNVGQAVQKGSRPKFSNEDEIPEDIVKLVKKCWDTDIKERPSTREIIEEITRIQVQLEKSAAESMVEFDGYDTN